MRGSNKAMHEGVSEVMDEIYGSDAVTDPDPDGDLEAMGPDSDAIAASAEVDIQDELDDEDNEDELFDLAADESLHDDDVDDIEHRFGRRAVAARVRQAFQPKVETVEAFGAGYCKALDDLGVPSKEAKDRFGALSPRIREVASAATRGLLGGQSIGDAVSKLTGGKGASSLAEQAGTSLREQMRFGPLQAIVAATDKPGVDTGVEADAGSLPPVYVEDEAGFEEDSSSGEEDLESFGSLCVQDQFGAVCRYGYVGGQPRRKAREAAHRSVVATQKYLPSVPRSGKPKPFVEDRGARPVLFSDGKLLEPVYGALCPVPCPSCTRTVDAEAAKGASTVCVVCEGYGAILIPKDDLRTYVSADRYGIIPLLIPAAVSVGKGISQGKLFPKAADNVKQWFKKVLDRHHDEEETSSDEEFDKEPVRALVPHGAGGESE